MIYSLSLDEFRSYAKQGNLIPLFREILADQDTPVSAFAKIDHGPSAYLLESIQGGENGRATLSRQRIPARHLRRRGTYVSRKAVVFVVSLAKVLPWTVCGNA